MKIIVTGAAGFIGSHVAKALLARGDEVLGIDDFNDFYDPKIKEKNVPTGAGFALIRGSFLDQDCIAKLAAFAPDAIVHLGAYAGVRPSIERPLLYQKTNIEGTHRLLEMARGLSHTPKFIFASSSSVYGNNEKVPFHEDDRVDHPISPYAATKRSAELICHTYHHLFAIDITCLRFFTVYGPGQRPDLAIHKFARLIDDGQPIMQFGDGTSSRDYTYISDTVRGVLLALEKCSGYRIINLGSAAPVTLKDLIAAIGKAVGKKPIVRLHPMQAGDVTTTYADLTRAKDELGYEPEMSLAEGLERFVAWLRLQ